MTKILVIDDELNARMLLKDILEGEGYEVLLAENGKAALETIAKNDPVLVLLDLMLPDIDGLEVLKGIKKLKPKLEVVMVSAFGTVDFAVKAIKLGAYEFLQKPLDADRVLLTVKNTLKKARLEQELGALKADVLKKYRQIGNSPAIKSVFALIERAAKTKASVFITGESGVGKELVARAIHFKSDRGSKPFIPLNCAAIPTTLIESELFGFEKGSFTGASKQKKGKLELSDGGSLFLDEIGDMGMETQAKFLRFLEEGEFERVGGVELIKVDARIIAATNKDLKKEIANNNFREDLFYRLNVVPIEIPPLRERKEDIPLLVNYFLDCFAADNGLSKKEIADDAMAFLAVQHWSGNVRELRNVIERIVTLSPSEVIAQPEISFLLKMGGQSLKPEEPGSLKAAQERFERDYIVNVLTITNWKIEKTAEILGIDRTNLYRKMKRFGIEKG